MNKISEELLDKIKAGKAVDSAMLVGNISTPVIPDEVFTIVYKANGEEFKRYLEADKWIAWLNSVAEKNIDPEADLEEKAIVGTKLYNQCELSIREIDRKRNGDLSGTIWLYNANPYTIALQGKQIDEAKNALAKVHSTAFVPMTEDRKFATNYTNVQCDTDAILDIVSRGI